MSKGKSISPDDFSKLVLSKHLAPFEGENFGDTYSRVVNALTSSKWCVEKEAKMWTAQTIYQHLKKTGKLP